MNAPFKPLTREEFNRKYEEKPKMTPTETAKRIKAMADDLGWTIEVRMGTVLTISKRIITTDDFVRADMEYGSILDLLPQTSAGSVWGTDGGGVGSMSAMGSGRFVMNKTGGSKRVLNALKKII